ncbi:MAG: ABC transporter ATP-binding protein [Sneathiella sp.]|jgi:branched-chain amino acid transport system ATP-binding protein|uniref:ABC transporter ATP-binding protein n=1 Tax=Sneathiella sp. TaxID=1964365 RepID=UPI000C39F22C|nr:ABC transporter ATP-binding protein [Sneathiella sp.]MAL80574.1 ABC transporter ATP-binding protein [Sneathiella sp.]|tara:strand:+ start:37 stop:750 length:714 start_codon:yes stop_codon:yes gene_type:complete
MSHLLEVKGLHASYGPTNVLNGLDFSLEKGGVTTILGANGAGKTTTLRAISGMVTRSGEIKLEETDIGAMATADITRQGIAHVPEGRGTFVRMSTEDNLNLGAYSRNDKAGIAEDIERVYSYFPILKQRRTQQAGTLSGGEAQMLAVGRALMLRPRLLLLDEPSFGLAPLIVQELFAILKRINVEEGVSMLLVEQNAALALEMADHAYLLETGNIVISGTSQSILENETVRRSYLGY